VIRVGRFTFLSAVHFEDRVDPMPRLPRSIGRRVGQDPRSSGPPER